MCLRSIKCSPNPMQIQMGKKVISPCQIPEKEKEKREKYPKWQYNQVLNVWSPVFTKAMFGMPNLRSALFRVPFLQFSRRRPHPGSPRKFLGVAPPILSGRRSILLASRDSTQQCAPLSQITEQGSAPLKFLPKSLCFPSLLTCIVAGYSEWLILAVSQSSQAPTLPQSEKMCWEEGGPPLNRVSLWSRGKSAGPNPFVCNEFSSSVLLIREGIRMRSFFSEGSLAGSGAFPILFLLWFPH